MMGTGKSLLVNISLSIISTLSTLLVGEIYIRYGIGAWPFEPRERQFSHLTEKDTNLRWRFSPGNGRNSLGLRNQEVREKNDQGFRILFLGDSLIASGDTTSGELYTQVIEKNLNRKLEITQEIEVINAGVAGYTTYQELEFLNIYGWDMQPDLVILGFVLNDVYYPYLHRPTQEDLLGMDPKVQLHRFAPDSFPGNLVARSYLAHKAVYTLQLISNKLSKKPSFPFEQRDDFYLAWKDYGWTMTDLLIHTLKQQLDDKGIPFMIIIFPVRDQVNDQYLAIDHKYVLYPQTRITEISSRYQIPFLDLTEALYQNGGTKLFADYLHLNEVGDNIVANQVTQYLLDTRSFWLKDDEH